MGIVLFFKQVPALLPSYGTVFLSFLALHRNHLNLLEPTLLHRIFRLVKLFRAVRVLRQVWELKILMHLGCCFERQLRGF